MTSTIERISQIQDLENQLNLMKADRDVARTCDEIHWFNPSSPSGTYWIDPDGPASGDGPIQVVCNITSGKV